MLVLKYGNAKIRPIKGPANPEKNVCPAIKEIINNNAIINKEYLAKIKSLLRI